MEYFDIYKLDNFSSEILVAMKTYEPPLDYLGDIRFSLKSINFSGMVVIDQLLHSGNTSERFITAFFDGENFKRDSFEFKEFDRRSEIRKYVCEFLRNDLETMDSTLNQTQKRMISKGCYI